jgi:hypothetical protein
MGQNCAGWVSDNSAQAHVMRHGVICYYRLLQNIKAALLPFTIIIVTRGIDCWPAATNCLNDAARTDMLVAAPREALR